MEELYMNGPTFLQKKEVEEGKKAGLRPDQIAVYSRPGLNFKQMKVLREAMADGLSTADAALIGHPWISAETMKELIAEMKSGKKITVPKKKRQWRNWLLPVMAFLSVTAAAVFLILEQPPSVPVLSLKAREIRIPCGMPFEPGQYVQTVPTEGFELILPDSFVCRKPETRLVMYELKGKNCSVRKIMRVEAVDDSAPVITLARDRTELLKAAKFSCHAFVMAATDNVDGDITGRVSCSDVLADTESQKVIYTVKDRAGNTAEAFLTVHYADYGSDTTEQKEEDDNQEEVQRESGKKNREPEVMRALPDVPSPSEPVWNQQESLNETEEEYEEVVYTETVVQEQPAGDGSTLVEHHISSSS